LVSKQLNLAPKTYSKNTKVETSRISQENGNFPQELGVAKELAPSSLPPISRRQLKAAVVD